MLAQVVADAVENSEGRYLSVYVSDRISRDRFTVEFGVRFDRSTSSLLEASRGANPLVQVIAPGEPRLFEANGLTCRFVRPPRGFTGPNGAATDGVTVVDRLGLDVKVTTLERTIADLFDRHKLAGGAEELFNSLDLVARVDAGALVRHARTRGNAAAAGAVGFWLEHEQERLGVPQRTLEDLRALVPSRPRYALGARPGSARMAKHWNVILPVDVVERRFEGL